jgi:hypothetical protein
MAGRTNTRTSSDRTSRTSPGSAPRWGHAIYATAVRAGGQANGKPLGALGIFFDWQAQATGVVGGVRLSDEERSRTRCLLLDARHRVIAASDGQGVLTEIFPFAANGGARDGHYLDADGAMVGFALTPGYETYRGLGWYGVIVQALPSLSEQSGK